MNSSAPHNSPSLSATGNPSVAIVILNWNGKSFLEKFLPSVLRSTYSNRRVIVADNASTDGSIDFISNAFPTVEIIQNKINAGFAKGYNMALRNIESDYFVLLNSDVEVTDGWMEPIISLLESDNSIAACQPKILSFNEKNKFEYAGAAGGWIDSFGYPFARGRVFEHCEVDLCQYDQPEACFWASGAAMFVRAKVFKKLGGFDEFFFAHQEEIDLCWRMQQAGYKIYVQPTSVVYHVGGGTLPQGNSRKTYLNFRNNMIMLHKNLPLAERAWKIPYRILLNAAAATKSLFSGDIGSFVAISKAHQQYLQWWLFEKHESRLNQSSALKGVYKGNLVIDYYIRGKKTFAEIVKDK